MEFILALTLTVNNKQSDWNFSGKKYDDSQLFAMLDACAEKCCIRYNIRINFKHKSSNQLLQ